MTNNYYVYFHVKPNEELPFYVGRGKNKRAYSKCGRNKHWHNIVNKYGYKIDIEYKNLTNEEACQLEIDLIKFYGRQDLCTGILVNMTDGGESSATGLIHSVETKQKMSEAKKNNTNALGKKFPPRSKEHLAKISAANKGKAVSEVTRQKLSEKTRNHWAKIKGELDV